MKNFHYFLISGTLILSVVGCGSGGDTPISTTVTGEFVDAPVAGLSYSTSSGSKGFSSETGKYSYRVGDSVTFNLGNLTLGANAATSTMTPSKFGDTIKATNIALLLQNFDIDEVSTNNFIQLPSSDLLEQVVPADVDLYDDSAVDTLLVDARNRIEESLHITLPTISRTTAYNNLKYNVNYIAHAISYEDFINKSYTMLSFSDLFGPEVLFDTVTLKQDYFFEYSQYDQNNSVPYTHYDNGYLNVVDINFYANEYAEGVHDYYKFLDKSDDIISVCVVSNPAVQNVSDEIENCLEANAYFVLPNKVSAILDNLSKEAILQDKIQILSFSSIQNRYLYRVNLAQADYLNRLYIQKDAIWIESNGLTNFYSDELVTNTLVINWPNNLTPVESTYNASFINNQVIFYENGTLVNAPAYVYKYNLAGTTIPASSLIKAFNPSLDDENVNAVDELLNLFPVKSFTFTSGSLYCDVLDGCRLDALAFEQFMNQLNTP